MQIHKFILPLICYFTASCYISSMEETTAKLSTDDAEIGTLKQSCDDIEDSLDKIGTLVDIMYQQEKLERERVRIIQGILNGDDNLKAADGTLEILQEQHRIQAEELRVLLQQHRQKLADNKVKLVEICEAGNARLAEQKSIMLSNSRS